MNDYLEINLKVEPAVELIKKKIVTKTPFVFTRYGDGEIRIINNVGNVEFKSRIAKKYSYPDKKWQEAYVFARDILMDTLKHTDLVGLFDNDGILKGKMKVNKTGWSIKKKLLSKYGIKSESLKICDHQISRGRELGDINQFKKILNGNSLCIVSPHEDKLKAKNISKLLEADVSYMGWPMPLNVNDRASLFKKLDKITADVIIFGTSQGGKDIGVYLKEKHGKVCIDYGATLDAWAGIVSRKWFGKNGAQNYCLIK